MRAYLVRRKWDSEKDGFIVIADTVKEAIKISYKGAEDVIRFIDIRAKWVKHANVYGLSKGVLRDQEGRIVQALPEVQEGK